MYTIYNLNETQVDELIWVNNYPIEMSLYAGEYLHNIPAYRITLQENSKLKVKKQYNWIEPSKIETHLGDDVQELCTNIKYKTNGVKDVKKILIAPTHIVRQEWLVNIQYSRLSLENIFMHLSVDGLLIITLIDYVDAQGRYFLLDESQEEEFKLFIENLLEKHQLEYSDIYFAGGSKAGSGSIYLSSLLRDTTVLAMMPQFFFSQYFSDSLGRINLYFLEQQGKSVDFIQYINDYTNYHFYVGTLDSKSHHGYHYKYLMSDELKNMNIHLINSKHDLQLYYPYDLTYQVAKNIQKYEKIISDDIEVKFRIEGNELFIQSNFEQQLSKRVSAEVELDLGYRKVYYHLLRLEGENKFHIKDLNTNEGSINLLELIKHDYDINRLTVKVILKDIMEYKYYESSELFIPFNLKKESNVNNVEAIGNKLEVLNFVKVNQVFYFEAQTRFIDLGEKPQGILFIKTKTNHYQIKLFVQKRKYSYRIFCNMRAPIYIFDDISEVSLQILNNGKVYIDNIDLLLLETYE